MYQVWSNPLKDVDPRVFTRIVTDGSVTISPRNFVGEGIINCPLYIDNREIMFNNIGELCPKFKDLPNEAKMCMAFYKRRHIST